MRCSVTSDSHHAVCVPRTDSFYNWDIVLSTPPLITSFIATPLHRSLRFFHTICSTSFEFASNVIHTEHIPNNTAALPTNINITQRGTRDPSWRCPDRTSGGKRNRRAAPSHGAAALPAAGVREPARGEYHHTSVVTAPAKALSLSGTWGAKEKLPYAQTPVWGLGHPMPA